jgi:hypothetical protein
VRPVLAKLAKGESLDDDDVAWARERGIPLPAEYGSQTEASNPDDEESAELGLEDDGEVEEDGPDLARLSKAELLSMAESKGIDVLQNATKAELIEALQG